MAGINDGFIYNNNNNNKYIYIQLIFDVNNE